MYRNTRKHTNKPTDTRKNNSNVIIAENINNASNWFRASFGRLFSHARRILVAVFLWVTIPTRSGENAFSVQQGFNEVGHKINSFAARFYVGLRTTIILRFYVLLVHQHSNPDRFHKVTASNL